MKILSCGAGMQSTALALMACENAREPGKFPCVPIYDLVCFCDLGKEPPWVMKQVTFIEKACQAAGIRFEILKSPLYEDYLKNFGNKRVVSIPFWTIGEDGKKGRMLRNCTLEYKIGLIIHKLGIVPKNYKEEKAGIWVDSTLEEAVPLRGSSFCNASYGGASALNLYGPRTNSGSNFSLRSALILEDWELVTETLKGAW